MKSWLKFFGLSFFSDKIAKQAKDRGFGNFFLGLLLALVFVFCGLLAANVLPFTTHYGNASDFRAFAQEVTTQLDLTVNDGVVASANVVNTFENAADKQKYGTHGYNLIVDTHPITALDDFETYCVYYDGSSQITYEAYLALPEEEKINYVFNLVYTPNELVLTSEMVAAYEQYLSASDNKSYVEQYDKLVANKDKLSQEDYERSVYALYLQAYYPEITKYVAAGSAPILRNYYYTNYLNNSDVSNYLVIFDDLLVGSFHTDNGLAFTFYGFYTNAPTGKVTAADDFIKQAFSATTPVYANMYLSNIFRYVPLIALIPLALALLAWGVLKATKSQWGSEITTLIKAEGAYLAVSALIAAVVLFVCGYFVSGALLNELPLAIFALILLIRTVILIIYECQHGEKITKTPTSSEENQ